MSLFTRSWSQPCIGGLIVAALCLAMPARSQAAIVYSAILSGPAEAPPNASPGTGNATVTFDTGLMTMQVQAAFSGLTGNVTAAHIHAPTAVAGVATAGVATQTPTFVDFPVGVTSGTYDKTFDMTLASSYNAAFVTANGGTTASAFNALLTAAAEGKSYLNIHTSTFGGGEIRGFFTAVPEPSSLMFTAALLAGMVWRRRR